MYLYLFEGLLFQQVCNIFIRKIYTVVQEHRHIVNPFLLQIMTFIYTDANKFQENYRHLFRTHTCLNRILSCSYVLFELHCQCTLAFIQFVQILIHIFFLFTNIHFYLRYIYLLKIRILLFVHRYFIFAFITLFPFYISDTFSSF